MVGLFCKLNVTAIVGATKWHPDRPCGPGRPRTHPQLSRGVYRAPGWGLRARSAKNRLLLATIYIFPLGVNIQYFKEIHIRIYYMGLERSFAFYQGAGLEMRGVEVLL